MHLSLLTFLALSAANAPAVAILPPVAIDGNAPWLGYLVADQLSNDLLAYPSAKKASDFQVFSWRETASAARAEGLDLSKPLSPASLQKLARQLGARYLFAGSYKVQKGRVLLKWRLWDSDAKASPPKDARVTTNLATLSARTDALTNAVLSKLGQKPRAGGAAPRKWPVVALEAYGRGIEILARQSLDSHAPVVLPPLELKKARLLFEQAIGAAPKLERARIGIALTSAMLGDLERAEKEVLQATAMADTLDPMSFVGVYYLQVRQGAKADALRTLEDAMSRYPRFLGALGYLGTASLRGGDTKKAETVFRDYTARVPKSPWARLMHARAVAYAGKPDAGLDEARAVLRDFGDSLAVLSDVAARLNHAKEYDEAIALMKRGMEQYGEHPVLLTRMSYALLQKGETKAGLELAERAILRLGKDGRGETMAGYAYVNLGHALALAGKKDDARKAFERAAALGTSVEDRLLLLTEENNAALLQESASALAADAPPPPPPASPEPPPPTAPTTTVDEGEAEEWNDEGQWEGEDWDEAAHDDAP